MDNARDDDSWGRSLILWHQAALHPYRSIYTLFSKSYLKTRMSLPETFFQAVKSRFWIKKGQHTGEKS